jgi:hypothetical protein
MAILRSTNIRRLFLGRDHGAFVHVLRMNGFTSVSGVDASEEQVALEHQL